MQDVLDRACVGRSTFYLHFRDKNDLLLSQLERFGEHMSTLLSVQKEKSLRVAPVAEMFAHVEEQKKLYRILGDAGRLKDFFDLAQDYFARGIEQRLIETGRLSRLSQSRTGRFAPPRSPGACCHCCDGGSITARKSPHRPWMNSSTAWSGTDFGSH